MCTHASSVLLSALFYVAMFAQHDAVSSMSAAVMLTDGYPLVAGWEDAELEGQYFVAFKLDPSDGTLLWKWQVHAPVGSCTGRRRFRCQTVSMPADVCCSLDIR